MRVAVLGVGLQGASVAMELASCGTSVGSLRKEVGVSHAGVRTKRGKDSPWVCLRERSDAPNRAHDVEARSCFQLCSAVGSAMK